MNNNKHKNEWIEEVMGSTRDMHRAVPPAGLYEAVRSRLESQPSVKTISLPVVRWAVAAILLLALNIGSAVYYVNHSRKAGMTNTENAFTAELQPVSTYNY